MPKQPDYTEATAIFQKSMQDALANLDKVTEDAKNAHEEAIELQIAGREELNRIEREASTISNTYVEQHRKEIEERLRSEVLFSIVKKLILFGMKSTDIISSLEVTRKMIGDAWIDLGFTMLGNHAAHVSYEDQGRAGNVIFYREDVVLKFWYEFAGGTALAFVNVPTEEKWNAETKLPLEERMPILTFIAERIIRDKANDYKYEIKPDSILISL